MTTWMLVDGNSLTYRAFFALPTDIATASGQVTNAVYGFTSMLLNLLRDHQPDRVVVAFDRPEPTFRHEALESYKAQREKAPDILYEQFGLVRQVIDGFGIESVDAVGFEADDVLATLASRARDRGEDVVVVTGDRDAYQLVEDPSVAVLYTHARGVSELKRYDEAAVLERTGVGPASYVWYAALRGDPSDNLPGVPGVGEKTAAKLVTAYGDLDGIFAHVEDQTPKLRTNLVEHEEVVRRNADLMYLVRDVPLDIELDDIAAPAPDGEALNDLFSFLEFRSTSISDRLSAVLDAYGATPIPATDHSASVLGADPRRHDDPAELAAALVSLRSGAPAHVSIAGAWEGDEGRSTLVGLALVDPDGDALWVSGAQLTEEPVRAALAEIVGLGGIGVVAHDAKSLMRSLLSMGIDVRTLVLDTSLAAYLLDPAEGRYVLGEVLERYTSFRLPSDADAAPAGQLSLSDADEPGGPDVAVRAATAALGAQCAAEPLLGALDAQGLRRLHDDVEVPLVRVLARMEHVGVGVDGEELGRLNGELAQQADELRARICADAGREFNVNSTPQLREVIFDELGLTPSRKTKTGYSTDAASLEKLRGEHPIIEHLLRYREVEKLRSTYGEGLLGEIAADGRIHATFHQTVARTGRLSSDRPNLHNIPVRSDEGRAFRRAFVPAPGRLLLVADYNQVELRCIAHLAADPGLLAAFEAGTDIHTETAARVFAVEPDAVTPAQRAQAKMVSYGLAYGMEAYGLAQRLAIATRDAQVILDAYFEAFPAVAAYMERTVTEARERGYTETLFGRRRRIPELSSPNHRLRQAGERQAMNAGIQGLAADIFKVALVRIDAALDATGCTSTLILQVHDEVLVEVDPGESDAVTELVLDAMTGAFELRVPLEVNLSLGQSWADAKG